MHTFKQTNKSYIGYTGLTLSKRLHKHITNSQSGHDTHFYKAIRKYGPKSITSKIICECSSREEALEKEKYYIKHYDTFKNGYNMTIGGDGGWIVPDEKYDEWCLKNSISTTGEKNPNYSGFTDEEILESAFSYFQKEGQLPRRKWQIYSSETYGFPKSYSKFRFKKYGSGLSGFVNAMKEIYNLEEKDFKYKRTKSHNKKLSNSLKGKNWYYNENLKISKQLSLEEYNREKDNWKKGRKYATKNN
jgi:hypothetical protein